MDYYVKIGGNNLSDGLSIANAFATITKGIQTVQAGDTLYIMPGLYSELVTLVTSGTALNRIKIICCNNGIDLVSGNLIDASYKGEVILSFCDNLGNVVLNTVKFDFNSKSYVDLFGIKINSLGDSINLTGTNNNIYYSHTNTHGTTGANGIFGNLSTYKTDNNNVFYCTSRGTYRGFQNIKNIWYSISNNSIGFANIENIYYSKTYAVTGFNNITKAVNCEAYNCNIGFNNLAGNNCTVYNCLVANSNIAYSNNLAAAGRFDIFNCYSINNNTVAINTVASWMQINLSQLYQSGSLSLPSGATFTGTINTLSIYWAANCYRNDDIEGLIIRNTVQDTTQLVYDNYRDLNNQPLKLIDNIVKAGATQRSIKEYNQLTGEFKILRKGIYSTKPRLAAGNYTASCLVKYDLGGGTLRPQILVRDYQNNKLVNESEATIDVSIDYIEVSITFDVKNDGIIDLQVFNREAGINAYCLIKDFKLQKN